MVFSGEAGEMLVKQQQVCGFFGWQLESDFDLEESDCQAKLITGKPHISKLTVESFWLENIDECFEGAVGHIRLFGRFPHKRYKIYRWGGEAEITDLQTDEYRNNLQYGKLAFKIIDQFVFEPFNY